MQAGLGLFCSHATKSGFLAAVSIYCWTVMALVSPVQANLGLNCSPKLNYLPACVFC